MCVCAYTLLESAIVFHQADKCLRICVNEHVHVCDRVLQRARLAARVWALHASFIPLTSDKAEALLVMMWLLLPIMPRCRPGRKTVRYILIVPHRPPMETSTLLLFYEAFSLCWDTYWHTHGNSFTKLFSSLISSYYLVKHENITLFTFFMSLDTDIVFKIAFTLHSFEIFTLIRCLLRCLLNIVIVLKSYLYFVSDLSLNNLH